MVSNIPEAYFLSGLQNYKVPNIWSITMTNQPSDSKYHNVSGPTYTVTKDQDDNVTGVTGTYTSTEKPLKDVYTMSSSSDGF